jgi:hypothetical protein
MIVDCAPLSTKACRWRKSKDSNHHYIIAIQPTIASIPVMQVQEERHCRHSKKSYNHDKIIGWLPSISVRLTSNSVGVTSKVYASFLIFRISNENTVPRTSVLKWLLIQQIYEIALIYLQRNPIDLHVHIQHYLV